MHIGRYNRRRIVGLTTKVALAKKGTKPLKTTVPEGIVEFLQLSDKDELNWNMHVEDGARTVVLQKKIGGKDTLELARFAMKQKRKRDSIGH